MKQTVMPLRSWFVRSVLFVALVPSLYWMTGSNPWRLPAHADDAILPALPNPVGDTPNVSPPQRPAPQIVDPPKLGIPNPIYNNYDLGWFSTASEVYTSLDPDTAHQNALEEYRKEMEADAKLFREDRSAAMADRILRLPGHIYNAVRSGFMQTAGLDPALPFVDQLGIGHRYKVFEPIKGYATFTPGTMYRYHQLMFTDRIRKVSRGVQPAHERALLAIQYCDKSLLNAALRELDFILEEYNAVYQTAKETHQMNTHQSTYYNQELTYILDPNEDPRRRTVAMNWDQSSYTDLSKFLGREAEKEDWQTPHNPKREDILSEIDARIRTLHNWNILIEEVLAYIDRNRPTLAENKRRVLAAFNEKACSQCEPQ